MKGEKKNEYLGAGIALAAAGIGLIVTVSTIGGILMIVAGLLFVASAYGFGSS